MKCNLIDKLCAASINKIDCVISSMVYAFFLASFCCDCLSVGATASILYDNRFDTHTQPKTIFMMISGH